VIKGKLSRGEPALLTQLHFTDPSVFELTSLMGFDGIWMDLEHHTYSMETATAMMRAARVGRSDIVARAAKGEFMRLSRLLEAGAQGIMYPRCDDAAEAREVVEWSKFAPMGKRGFDGGNPDMPYTCGSVTEYIEHANEQTFIIMQLEEEASLRNAEEIAAVPGVDVLFFGPGDFSVLSGIPGQMDHPKILDAVKRTAKAAESTGKHWGTPALSLDHAKRLLDMGATFICYMADIVLVKQGLELIQEQFEPLGFKFDNQVK
jgi:4-hydroxy-2-oxoheptanedioate aldolase